MRYKRLQRRWNLTAEEICCHWSILCTLLFKSCCFLLSVSQSFSSESPTGADCCNARFAIEINIRFSQECQSPLPLRGLKILTWDCSFKSISSSNSKMACVKFLMRWVPQWCENGFALVNLCLDNGGFKRLANKMISCRSSFIPPIMLPLIVFNPVNNSTGVNFRRCRNNCDSALLLQKW